MVYLFSKIVKGKKYYYLGENKSIGGQSRRISETYLGSADNLKKFLENDSLPKEVESLSFGLPATIMNLSEEIDFVKIIDSNCPKRNQGLSVGEHILIDLINRIDEQQSHNKLGKWFSKTILRKMFKVKDSYLSSQNYWNHWQYLNEEKIENIQKELLPNLIKNVDLSQIFYDPTNFSTYIEDKHKDNPKNMKRHAVSMAKYGKPKSGIKGLRQINLALLVTKDFGIPLWHKTYEGNINDVTFFKNFINSLMDKIEIFAKQCKNITITFDKGNNSPKNIERVGKDLHFYVLGSLVPSQHIDLLKIPLSKFDIEYKNSEGNLSRGHALRKEVFGKSCKIVISYNEKTAYNQKNRTERALAKALKYLKNAKEKLNGPQWTDRDKILIRIATNISRFYATKFVKWRLVKKGKNLVLNFEENKEELSIARDSYGKNILFTDNNSLSNKDIIKAYGDKDVVERSIRQLKNKHIISYTPQYCWTDESSRVHAFTCVMALLFCSLLKKKVAENKIDLSREEIINNLAGIRQSHILMSKSNKIHSTIEKMSPPQKSLYSLLNLKKYES